MKKALSLVLSVLMITTTLFALPFTTVAANKDTMMCPVCSGTGQEDCTECNGTGQVEYEYEICPECNGAKTFENTCQTCYGTGQIISDVACSTCNGTGYTRFETCVFCQGSGVYNGSCCLACNGMGVNAEVCHDCDGYGHYISSCGDCGGAGKIITDCTRCGGTGRIITQNDDSFAFDTSAPEAINVGEVLENKAESTKNTTGSITYNSSDDNIATVDENGSVTAKKAGNVTITASITTDYTYSSKDISYSLTVNKGTPFIEAYTAGAISYNQTLADSSFTSITAKAGNIAVEGTAEWKNKTIKPAVTDSDSTYYKAVFTPSNTTDFESVEFDATVKVNPAAITITAEDKESNHGTDIAELTYTLTGTVAQGDDLGIQLSTTADKTKPGDYPINVSYTVNNNYAVTTQTGTYTVGNSPHYYGTEGDERFTCTVCGEVDADLKAQAEAADKDAADTAAANTVTDKINALPEADKVTTADEKAITEAREAYDSLTDDQTAQVTPETVNKLTEAENALEEAQAQEAPFPRSQTFMCKPSAC